MTLPNLTPLTPEQKRLCAEYADIAARAARSNMRYLAHAGGEHEAISEAYLALLNAVRRYRPERGLPERYFSRCVRLHLLAWARDRLKRCDRKTQSNAPDLDVEPQESNFEQLLADHEQTQKFLGSLDPESGRAVSLRFGLEGGRTLPYAEVGERLGLSREGARRQVMKALKALRDRAGVRAGQYALPEPVFPFADQCEFCRPFRKWRHHKFFPHCLYCRPRPVVNFPPRTARPGCPGAGAGS